jgi:UPF0716 family protein affecting phage T7 exclusion
MTDSARRRALASVLRALGPFLGLLLVVGLFSAVYGLAYLTPFTSAVNLKTVLVQTVIVAVGAGRYDVRRRLGRHRPLGRLQHRADDGSSSRSR